MADALVVVGERLSAIGRDLRRETAPAQIGVDRIETGDSDRQSAAGTVDENLVPVNAHVGPNAQVPFTSTQFSLEMDGQCLRPADGYSHARDWAPLTGCGACLQQRGPQLEIALMRGDVVARERVVGPAGCEQDDIRRTRSDVEMEVVWLCVTPDVEQGEPVDVLPIQDAEASEHVAAVAIGRGHWRPRTSHRRRRKAARARRAKPLVREYPDAGVVVDGHELQVIDEQGFFELVGDAEVVLAAARLQPAGSDPDVLVWIGCVPDAGGHPITDFAAAHEVGHELKT